MSSLRDYLFRDQRRTFRLLSWAALGTILIVVVNLSNPVLARQRFRRRELAVHAALAASRASLLVRLAIENALIAIAATPLAVLVARIICAQLRDRVTPELSQTFLPIVDARTAIATGVLAAAVAIAVTLIAARETWRGASPIALLPGLHSGGSRRHAGRRLLIAIEGLSKWYVRPASFATILTVFASLTLLIAAVGTAGIVGYSVVLRYRELGIRLALGATQRAIQRLVLAEALIPATAGILAGLAGTFAFASLLQQEIFQARTFDLPAYTSAALVINCPCTT